MKITDKQRLNFIEKTESSISHRSGRTESTIKWAVKSFAQYNCGKSLREAIDSAIKELESGNNR